MNRPATPVPARGTTRRCTISRSSGERLLAAMGIGSARRLLPRLPQVQRGG
jgi:hypothetical protein